LANKCSIASRIDCFSDVQSTVVGAALHQQVEDRLKFYDTGVAPTKNADVMKAALEKAGSFYATPSKSKSEKKDKSEKKERVKEGEEREEGEA